MISDALSLGGHALGGRLAVVGAHVVYYVDVATPYLDYEGSVMTDIFVADNLHLNDQGNAIWGATIKATLIPIKARFE